MACQVDSGEISEGDLYSEEKEEESFTGDTDTGQYRKKKTCCPCLSNTRALVGWMLVESIMLTFRSPLMEATFLLRGRGLEQLRLLRTLSTEHRRSLSVILWVAPSPYYLRNPPQSRRFKCGGMWWFRGIKQISAMGQFDDFPKAAHSLR